MPLFGSSHLATPSDGYNATTLRYDSTLVHSDSQAPRSRPLRLSSRSSSSSNSFVQRLEDVQDDLDRAHGEHRTKIVCAHRSLCAQLPLLSDLISGLQCLEADPTNGPRPSHKSSKKRRLNLYDSEDDEPALLSVKLKKVESTIKFQKQLLQPKQQLSRDPTFPKFITTSIQAHTPLKHAHLLQHYSRKYTLLEDANILSKHAASTLLKSRFTTSGSEPKSGNDSTAFTTGTRTITKVEINPLLLKRLGI